MNPAEVYAGGRVPRRLPPAGVLYNGAVELRMTPLVELYEPENLPRVLAAGATLIGVNNRDLRTFVTDLEHTLRMREQVPEECLLVGESGIRNRADVERLEAAGVDAMLVGETLMSRADVGAAVDELLGAKTNLDRNQTAGIERRISSNNADVP
jgi:indole-3-glycerol phosphate synthase